MILKDHVLDHLPFDTIISFRLQLENRQQRHAKCGKLSRSFLQPTILLNLEPKFELSEINSHKVAASALSVARYIALCPANVAMASLATLQVLECSGLNLYDYMTKNHVMNHDRTLEVFSSNNFLMLPFTQK